MSQNLAIKQGKKQDSRMRVIRKPIVFNPETCVFTSSMLTLSPNILTMAGLSVRIISDVLEMNDPQDIRCEGVPLIKSTKVDGQAMFCALMVEKYQSEIKSRDLNLLLDFQYTDSVSKRLGIHFKRLKQEKYFQDYERVKKVLEEIVSQDKEKYFVKREDYATFIIEDTSEKFVIPFILIGDYHADYRKEAEERIRISSYVDLVAKILLYYVAVEFSLTPDAMKEDIKFGQIFLARYCFFALMRKIFPDSFHKKTGVTSEKIGSYVGNIKPATVSHGLKKHEKLMMEDFGYKYKFNTVDLMIPGLLSLCKFRMRLADADKRVLRSNKN